eukprot:2738600-Prymnesium_polylepis.1
MPFSNTAVRQPQSIPLAPSSRDRTRLLFSSAREHPAGLRGYSGKVTKTIRSGSPGRGPWIQYLVLRVFSD